MAKIQLQRIPSRDTWQVPDEPWVGQIIEYDRIPIKGEMISIPLDEDSDQIVEAHAVYICMKGKNEYDAVVRIMS